jgi:glycosyltransferase involved in cell wall biosynthesis
LIEYSGPVEDVRPYLAQASVFVLPSYYREGVPRTLLEAMAMARPLITTDTPGCRETVSDAKNGLLVPARNIEALAQSMEAFLTHPEWLSPMGAASRRLAETLYDVRQVNEQLVDFMQLGGPVLQPSPVGCH